MRPLLVATLAFALGCESVTDVNGTWIGSMQVGGDVWTVRMTLVQSGDSLTGDGAIAGGTYHEVYFANGNIKGDSVIVRLRPVEDTDVNFAGTIHGKRIDADWGFGYNTTPAGRITFGKQ